MADKFQLKAIISAQDKLSPTLKGIALQAKIARKSLGDIRGSVGNLAKGLAISGAAAGATIFGLLKGVIGESAKFEKFESVLRSIEGSSQAARKAILWIDKFSNDTPYDLDEVTTAYTTLRGAGIDPTVGSLEAVANAAAGMNKPITQAAEAFRSALLGENDALKGFNVAAAKSGDQVAYTWFKNGKKMVSTAKASSREQIEATLSGIFNTLYPKAARNLSSTYDGMLAMIKGYYLNFMRSIGEKGLFDTIKTQIGSVIKVFEDLLQNGSLDALAQQISNDLTAVVKDLSNWVRSVNWVEFYNGVKATLMAIKSLISAIGGLKGILILFAAALIAGPIAAILSMTMSIVALGKAVFIASKIMMGFLLVNPVFAVIAASIALVAALAYTFYKHWEPIKAFFIALWDGIKFAFNSGWELFKTIFSFSPLGMILKNWAPVKAFFGGLWETAKNVMSSTPGTSGAQGAGASPLSGNGANRLAGLNNRTQVNGEMVVKFENAPPGMRVNKGNTNQSGWSLNPDVGYRPMVSGF